MTTVLSSTDAANRIASVWRGHQVRKIFSTFDSVKDWNEWYALAETFDEKIKTTPNFSHLVTAWKIALARAELNLINNQPDIEQDSYSYPDEGASDWYWNEGGYCDW